MGVPTPADIKRRPGANTLPAPTNDTDPIAGVIDMGAEVLGASIFDDSPVSLSGDFSHFNSYYFSNEEGAGGRIVEGKVWLPCGGRPILAAGFASIIDPTGANAGLQFRITAKRAGIPDQDTLTVVAGEVVGTVPFDLNSRYAWETVGGAPLAGSMGPDDLYLKFGSKTVAVIRAPSALIPSGANSGGSLYRLAVGGFNTDFLDNGGRTNQPTPIFGLNDYIRTGINDQAFALPTDFTDGDYFGVTVEKFYLEQFIPPENPFREIVALSGRPLA